MKPCHDALTGLPNRILFDDRLQQHLERAKRHKDTLFAVLFIDLDRFKIINDSLGHTVGDSFLITTAQRLQACLRPEDTISRFGGDEFAVLVSEISEVSDAIRVAERIQASMKGTALLGSVSRSSTASIGITIVNANYHDPQEMLRDADSTMYRAKAQGGGRYQLFDVDMYRNAMNLLQLETWNGKTSRNSSGSPPNIYLSYSGLGAVPLPFTVSAFFPDLAVLNRHDFFHPDVNPTREVCDF